MNHEKLICYCNLVGLAEELAQTIMKWNSKHANLSDQIDRALSSSILNLAEGNGKWHQPKERRRFFQMSMGSISEVAACLDLARIYRLVSENKSAELKNKLQTCYYQINKLP